MTLDVGAGVRSLMMTRDELVADLRRRANNWLEDGTAGPYWRGYAHGLRTAAEEIESNLSKSQTPGVRCDELS